MHFISTVTGKKFRARVMANCNTSNIMYLIEFRKCRKQYVGETEKPLYLRINGHTCRSDYDRQLSDKPVAEHFNTIGHSFDGMTVIVIEQLLVANSIRGRQRVSHWIYTLWTMTPDGLNLGVIGKWSINHG